MELSQSIQLVPLVKLTRRGRHKNPYYHREYYLKNREKLLTYSHNYYGVKKLLKGCLKPKNQETKIGVKKISFTDVREYNIKAFDYKSFKFWQRLGGGQKRSKVSNQRKETAVSERKQLTGNQRATND